MGLAPSRPSMAPARFDTFVAHRSPSTRPIAGRDRTWADSLRDREPALLLLHLDLLRDAGGVLCVGLGHGAVIHALAIQRTHACAEVEDMRRLGLLGSVFRRDPVHDIPTSGVFRVLPVQRDGAGYGGCWLIGRLALVCQGRMAGFGGRD